jgi:VanZ family protein
MIIRNWRFAITGIVWFFMMSALFVLPGSSLPKTDWLAKIQLDKIVHFVLFFILSFLFLKGLMIEKKIQILLLLACSSVYGATVEVIQHQFIANRSFDGGDILANMAGAIAGVLAGLRYIKNKPL